VARLEAEMTDDELRAAIPALTAGGSAVITGAASGIGLACATRFHGLGLHLLLADRDVEGLARAAAVLPGAATIALDVGKPDALRRLKEVAFAQGPVAVLMNNAGMGPPTKTMQNADAWREMMDVNFFAMLQGACAFALEMIAQGTPALIINTGSKQGITSPPGNPAYNVSKAAVKTYTEALAHELRNTPDCRVSAHLLVPGFTFTGITAGGRTDKPPGAWTAEQVADFMLDSVAKGDFYILCPDNETRRETDEKRMQWAVDDLIKNRPALSRWHPAYKDAFRQFMDG
jgi:short-subunit dehydrogenase